MVLRYIFERFLNNPEVVNKLSESYPIRRAAQLTVYVFHKGKRIGDAALQDGVKQGVEKLNSFSGRFKEELERGMKEAAEAKKKR